MNKLARLQSQQASIKELKNLDDKVLEYYRRVSQNLDALNFEEKRLLLDALEVKVFVYHDHNEVRGLLPPHAVPARSYVTIARTSGCLIVLDVDSNGKESLSILPSYGATEKRIK